MGFINIASTTTLYPSKYGLMYEGTPTRKLLYYPFDTALDTARWTLTLSSGTGTSDLLTTLGNYRLKTTATTSRYARLTANCGFRIGDFTTTYILAKVMTTTKSVLDANAIWRIGFGNTTLDAANCFAFGDMGNTDFSMQSFANDGTHTDETAPSLSAITNSTWFIVKLVITSSYVKCYINGTLMGTKTTKMPSTTVALYPIFEVQNFNAGNRDMYIESVRVIGEY